MHRVHRHWRVLHVDVPQLQRHVVARQNIPAIPAEFNVIDAADDFREKRARALQPQLDGWLLMASEHCLASSHHLLLER
mgnify:CR=1 FL=1